MKLIVTLLFDVGLLRSSKMKETVKVKANLNESILAEKPVIYLYSQVGLKGVKVEVEADLTDHIFMIPKGEENNFSDKA